MLEQTDVQRQILSKLETLVDELRVSKTATSSHYATPVTSGSGRYELDSNGNLVEKKSTGVAKAGMILGIITAGLLIAGAGGSDNGCNGGIY